MRFILEEEEELTLYKALRAFTKNKIDEYELSGADKHLDRIFPSGNLAQSKLWFEFEDDEKLFELLDLSDDDGWFARGIISGRDFDIESSDSIWDDFISGYGSIFYSLDEENVEKMQKISQYLIGKKYDMGSELDLRNLAKALDNLFQNQAWGITDVYHYCLNEEIRLTAKESIEKELNEFLEKIGFRLHRNFDILETTPANLIMWYLQLNQKELDFEDLFMEICKWVKGNSRGSEIGGWYDNQYEFRDSNNFDLSYYNREVGRNLDRIIDSMEEDETFSEKMKVYNQIFSLGYSFNEWNKLPKNKKYSFKIISVNDETGKIKVELSTDPYSYHAKIAHREVDIEGLKLLLHHPELFKLTENILKKF